VAEQAVVVTVSSGLSNGLQVATLAAKDAPLPVHVVDSRHVTIAEGFVALEAARAAAAGATAEEVVAVAEGCRERTGMFAALQTLEHLARGGRIGQVAVFLNAHTRLRPVLTIRDGRLAPTGLARDRARAGDVMLAATRRAVGDRPVRAAVLHTVLPEAEELAERVRSTLNCIECTTSVLSPVVGAHTGPDVLGIAYSIAA
jgi:DegV family protein with EDD domain